LEYSFPPPSFYRFSPNYTVFPPSCFTINKLSFLSAFMTYIFSALLSFYFFVCTPPPNAISILLVKTSRLHTYLRTCHAKRPICRSVWVYRELLPFYFPWCFPLPYKKGERRWIEALDTRILEWCCVILWFFFPLRILNLYWKPKVWRWEPLSQCDTHWKPGQTVVSIEPLCKMTDRKFWIMYILHSGHHIDCAL